MPAPRKVNVDQDRSVKTFFFNEEIFTVRNKYKIGKFFRALESNPVEALQIILTEESFEKFENLEIDMEDFKNFIEEMAKAASGSDTKN